MHTTISGRNYLKMSATYSGNIVQCDSPTKKRVAVRLSHVFKIPYETKQLNTAPTEPFNL